MNTNQIFHVNNNVRLLKIANTQRANEKPLTKAYDNAFNEPINLPSYQIEKSLNYGSK